MPNKRKQSPEYDVALSFAGEDRLFIEQVAENLRQNGIKVFYDHFYEVHIWGEDLVDLLNNVYSSESNFVIIFVSKHYKRKMWANYERQTILARLVKEKETFLLQAKFDGTKLKGIRDTFAYIDLRKETPESFSSKVIEKIKGTQSQPVNQSNQLNAPQVIHSAGNPTVLYSTNSRLAYTITRQYYHDDHYVWCSPYFNNSFFLHSKVVSPFTILNDLKTAIMNNDHQNRTIKATKIGLLHSAKKKRESGVITDAQYEDIVTIIRTSGLDAFRPLLYLIPYCLVENMLVPVPANSREHPLAAEFIIENLKEGLFDVIEL